MSAKHRKASKLAAKRTAIAATAIGATASIGLMGAPAQAAAPDYSQAISDYSHALDYFLNASNNVNNSVGSIWNPIAGQTGGVLPTFGSTFKISDATDLTQLSTILRNIANLNLPGNENVPGAIPDVILPGGSEVKLLIPSKLPGGEVLVFVADGIDTIIGLPVVEDIVDELPPLSTIINGLEATQSKFTSQYDWKLIGLSGQTNVLNTFLQTPDGISLNTLNVPGVKGNLLLEGLLRTYAATTSGIPIDEVDLTNVTLWPFGPGSLPSGTVWVPQGDGQYDFPLGARVGWWAAAPTAALKLPDWLTGDGDLFEGVTDTVISVPIGAGGVRLPLGLAEAGVVGANVLLPTANGVYSPVGLTMTNLNTILPFGVTNINVTTGNYVGTNGINVNNGQNLVLLQNPLWIPLPLLYGLGGFNFGTTGAGLTSPSLFGIKLFSDNLLQVGTPVGPNSSAGLIPEQLLPTDILSSITTGVLSPLGFDSVTNLLGIDAFIKPVMTAFGPVYQAVSAVTLKPISDFATSQYGPFINGSASSLLDFSKTLSEQTANLPGAPEQPELLTTADDENTSDTNAGGLNLFAAPAGKHAIENGGTPVADLLSKDKDTEQEDPKQDPPAPQDDAQQPTEPVQTPVTTPNEPPAEDPAEGDAGQSDTDGTDDQQVNEEENETVTPPAETDEPKPETETETTTAAETEQTPADDVESDAGDAPEADAA